MNIHAILKDRFGFERFRTGQEEVIKDVLAGKDTLAILPTGVGKSLCYQLPAYALPGTVLIISPLVSLMEDQVAIMKRNGEKRVVALNSFLSYKEKSRIIEEIAAYKFVFISPEMLLQPAINTRLKQIELSLIVVDEAHCISQWGFDFRPDYLRLSHFLELAQRPNILALTATADHKILKDIVQYLHLDVPAIHKSSLDRRNISYSIQKLETNQDKTEWIKERLQGTRGPGIIYVSSRKRADELASYLLSEGTSIASYHAGMEKVDRAFIQEQFISGEIDWICATNAFGMGIHKDDVRQVIHEHLPATIAGYIQEVGRAGRDGELSAATLLYAPEDEGKTRFIVQDDLPIEEEVRHYQGLLTSSVPSDEAATMAGLSETGKRVIDYYLESLSIDDTVFRLAEVSREKEMQVRKMLQIIHSNICIRKEVLSFFDEELEVHPTFCCSICGLDSIDWLLNNETKNLVRQPMDWQLRLEKLLG
ncbi:RecQ family ATP-dependent DNA helicase [Sporosarcina sp. CAU 1771]